MQPSTTTTWWRGTVTEPFVACDYPLTAWRAYDKGEGAAYMAFQRSEAINPDNPQPLPCGRCMGCRLDKSLEWGDRATHEASLYEDNCIVTLTYEDKYLPKNGSVSKRTHQLFMKRLRDQYPHIIRFMGCGEYGDAFGRPHYHICLFNHTFYLGREHWSTGPTGEKQYTSTELTKLWKFGLATFGNFTPEGARYVGRYCTKKQTPAKPGTDPELDPYVRPHPVTGRLHKVDPEFILTSRVPGLGFGWLQKNYSDVVPSGTIIREGQEVGLPRYYDKKLKEEHLHRIKIKRRLEGAKRKEDRTPERRKARMLIRASKMSLIKR